MSVPNMQNATGFFAETMAAKSNMAALTLFEISKRFSSVPQVFKLRS